MEFYEQPETPKQGQDTEKEMNNKVWKEFEHGQKNNPEKKPNEDGKDPNKEVKDNENRREQVEPSSDGQSSSGTAPGDKPKDSPRLPDADHAY